MNISKKQLFYIILVFAFSGLIYAYSNHFNNGFYFDDTHTIVYNSFIQDINNIPSFFTDLETFGTMPNNRTYRPVITTLNAIDYWKGDGLDPVSFHTSIFLSYIILGIALYFLLLGIFNRSFQSGYNEIIALLGTTFYMLHTANAETINYIIMRSDSFSTLCVLLGLLLYINPKSRKFQLHILSMIIGIASKESALMFAPILFVYVLFFETNISIAQALSFKKNKEVIDTIRKTLPTFIIGGLFFWFTRSYFRPESSVFAANATSALDYFFTQWYVVTHYIGNFFFPINLSADPDFKVITTLADHRILFSGLFLGILLAIAVLSSRKKEYRPISFGILWFFISLAPTSTIIPFGQVSNDHRTFFAYIGLVMAMCWFLGLVIVKNLDRIQKSQALTYLLPISILIILAGHVYGIRQRNDVWSNSEKLWKDVTIKSPNNGRGLMNYGLTLMAKNKLDETEEYFNRALKFLPYYSYLHINLGILKNAQGMPDEAEIYFQNALKYDPSNPEAYRFYARYLLEKGRNDEAIVFVENGLRVSPNHLALKNLQSIVNVSARSEEEKLTDQLKLVQSDPSVDNYLNLSLMYYKLQQYEKCIQTCEEILKIDSRNYFAYNNICISYVNLGEKEKAIRACEKALEYEPNFDRAKNNLNLAKSLN